MGIDKTFTFVKNNDMIKLFETTAPKSYGDIPEVSLWFYKYAPTDAKEAKEAPEKARQAAVLIRFIYSEIDGVNLPRLSKEAFKTPSEQNKRYLSFIISTYKKMSAKARKEYVSLAAPLLWQS